jgi:hypothetical protein
MKRSMCGLIVLAAATALWSCNGDPTDTFQEGERIMADPASLFLDQGASEFVVVEMVDNQGNQLAVDFEPQSVGPGITVEKDTTFLQTTIGTTLETRERFIVTGTSATASSFQLASRGQSITIPVKVTPIATSVTLSNPTPAANEPLVITLPPGYKFGAGAGANIEGAAGVVQSVSPDSSSITVLLPPGATGPVTVDSVAVDFAPGVLFSLPTENVVTVGAVTPLAGTGSPGTAPAITIAPVGGTTLFFDGGTFDYQAPIFGGAFGTFPSRLYNITVSDSTTLTTTVDWPSPEDLGIYFFLADGVAEIGSPGDAGAGGVHPETTTNTFAPGSYRMAIVNFNATNPPYFSLSITTEAPEE